MMLTKTYMLENPEKNSQMVVTVAYEAGNPPKSVIDSGGGRYIEITPRWLRAWQWYLDNRGKMMRAPRRIKCGIS